MVPDLKGLAGALMALAVIIALTGAAVGATVAYLLF